MSSGRQNGWRRVGGGDDKQRRVGGGDNKWWEAKLSKGDKWGEVAGGGGQNRAGEG